MKLKKLYQEVVKKGINADPRGQKAIENILKERKAAYSKLSKKEQEVFDHDSLTNPFSDTRILNGDQNAQVRSIMVGIDVDGAELLLVDKLKKDKVSIDLVLAHHPMGKAYANFYEVMDLQIDTFTQKGISVSCAESLLKNRKVQVERLAEILNDIN